MRIEHYDDFLAGLHDATSRCHWRNKKDQNRVGVLERAFLSKAYWNAGNERRHADDADELLAILNRNAPNGFYFGTKAPDHVEWGWWPDDGES